MSEDYEFVTRTAKSKKRKANNSGVKQATDYVLNTLIVIVAILIVISLVLIVTNDDLQSDIMNSKSKEQTEEANFTQAKSENQSNAGGEVNNQQSTPTGDTTEDPADLSHITFVPSNDSNVIQAWVNTKWTPYPTAQTGTHESVFDKDHIDYQEKVKLIYRDTEFTENDSIIWSIKNASGDAVAVFSTLTQSEVYRLTMTWIDGQGWQTTLIEQLKSLEGAY